MFMSRRQLGSGNTSYLFGSSAFFLTLSLGLSGSAFAADHDLKTIEKIPELMAAFDVDGLAVTAVKGDQILVSAGFGKTQAEKAYTSSTSCGLFSATKVLASLTYANLSAAGVLDLDAPLGDYIDDAPNEWANIPF